tara:strand:- start:339 stop:1223 length:885 start_codon:yes stop_codon:yes gene_type:complete
LDLITASKRIIDVLSSPFPGNCDLGQEVRANILIGLFVGLFLYFFQPFGMSQYQGNIVLLATWFGLTTFIASFTYYLFITFVLKIRQDAPSFTFGKWLVFIFGLIVVITLYNFLLFWILTDGQLVFSWKAFSNLFIKTAAIGFFPVSVSGLIIYYSNTSRFARQAGEIQLSEPGSQHTSKKLIRIPSQYAEDFSCEMDDIYAFEAQNNYVAIRHKADDTIKTSLIRNTLSAIQTNLPSHIFFRCHRSFITNLRKVDKVSGNAQGLVLKLKDGEISIPVSRSYINDLKSAISHLD